MDKNIEEIDKIKKDWIQRAAVLGYNTAANLMSILYPVDFEAYQISFELCDSEGKTLDYFTFPIMPSELSIKEIIPVKIENTFGGVNSISSNIFVPKDISLNGNFGRQFKIISRNKVIIPFYSKIIQERDYGVGGQQRKEIGISSMLKSGYGCLKVLQSIVNRSVEIDSKGECNKLYFYNMAYGESYLVKVLDFRGFQNISNNGIWSYDLNMKAVCPLHLDSQKTGKKWKNFGISVVQSSANGLTRGLKGTFNLN